MTQEYLLNNIYHGFRLIERRFVGELNAECFHFNHVKSGARLLKIASADPNKTFCIGFKTFPESDNGAPHIMEHSVLNGSRGFPVKSPFDVLRKGSLSTFLNAFTSKDYTMYPVASMNMKDYFNLVHVYLDAVFNPLIYDDPRILKQEGWHYELTGHDQPLRYTGVVYNEMKGAFSNPQQELWYHVFRHLFPGNAYGLESGGTPEAIPTLDGETFLQFHRKYYHPENSYIFLYGDADPDREMEFLDSTYLSSFERTGLPVEIEDQPAFPSMKEVTAFYPLMEGSDPENQTFLTYNFVAGHNTDLALTLALDILCEVLVNQESAPVRLALQEAGIGQDVSASASNFKQHTVQIAAINANPGDRQRFHEILTATLERVVAEGLNKDEVEGIINRIEFRLREGDDAQKGLTCLNMALPRWFFAEDPITGLEYEIPLAGVKTALSSDYLERIIRKYFLGNPHSLLLTLEPSTTLEKERSAALEAGLERYRASLTAVETENLIRETGELIAFQQREDPPEALATIPMLEPEDIGGEASFYSVERSDVSGIPVLVHEEFTNQVVYVSLYFDLRPLPQELIPYAALLANLAGNLSTTNYGFGDLNRALNIHTGGFFVYLRTFLEEADDNRMIPKMVVSSKAMNHKVDKLFELAGEILNNSVYDDPGRIRTLLLRHQSQLEAQVKGNGYHVASRRLSSYFSNHGMFGELTAGLSYYRFVTEQVISFDTSARDLFDKLKQVAAILFNRNNMTAAFTGEKKDLPGFSHALDQIAIPLSGETAPASRWNFGLKKANEGLLAASNVQYVLTGCNYKTLGHHWNGKLRVLNQVLSTDWLQTQVRVIGGAYGGFSSIAPSGNFTFNSYRDPNLESTLENYRNTVSYLESFEADRSLMTRYIIGTIAELDNPLTPSQKGEQAVSMYFAGRRREDVQKDRDDILSTTPGDIRAFAPMVADVLNQGYLCVYGSAERLTEHKELFNELVKVTP